MQIERIYNKTVDVLRLTAGANNTESWSAWISGIKCHIQPLEDRFTGDLEGNFGKDSLMLCGVYDIKEGDKIVDGGDEYRVTAQETYYLPPQITAPHHMEVVIRRFSH